MRRPSSLLIAIELAVGFKRQRNTYRLADAVSSISLGMLSQTSAVFTRLLRIGIYTALFEHVGAVAQRCVLDQPARLAGRWCSTTLLLLAAPHGGNESAVLWAAHAVHHQSQDYNLSTALRQTSSARCWAGSLCAHGAGRACRRWCLAWWR